jgi:hypothetical protein
MWLIHLLQSLLPYDISQKPTRSPTLSPTSPPMSSPTFAPVSPGPPPSGGTPFVPTPSGGCTLNNLIGVNNCNIEAPYRMLGYNKETICSACTGLDSDCTNTPNANGQYCVTAFTQSGYACAECKINGTVSFGCNGNQTCGTPRCVADLIEYCSDDHDADWCPPTPTSAPTRTPQTPAQIFNWVIQVRKSLSRWRPSYRPGSVWQILFFCFSRRGSEKKHGLSGKVFFPP